MEITTCGIIIVLTSILILGLDLVIIIGSKNLSSRVFVLLTFVTAIWVISHGFLVSTSSQSGIDSLIRFQSLLGVIIAIGFYQFASIYPYDKRPSVKSLIFSFITIATFAYLYFFTNALVSGVYRINGIGHWAWAFGPWHLLFDIFFYTLWILAFYRIFKTYKSAAEKDRTNLGNMFVALFFGIIPPTITNVFLPSLGEYHFNWLGPIASLIWIFIIAYSIVKYHQMNVRIVITEVLAICMMGIFFINIFVREPLGIIGRMGIFFTFLILGFYLIKGVLKEVEQRDQLNSLNATLAEKVAEQTAEIRQAYEAEKKARQDLEKLNDAKNQFITLTQHHLRAPATDITYGLESILAGSYGVVTSGINLAVKNMRSSAERLTRLVNDLLNITTLKAGRGILNIRSSSLKPAITDILEELHGDIEKMHVRVSYPQDDRDWPVLSLDLAKMREILFIVMDNAVRYNREGGSVSVTTGTRTNVGGKIPTTKIPAATMKHSN